METPIEEINRWISEHGERALGVALTQLAVANGLVELEEEKVDRLKSDLERVRAQLDQAKRVLVKFGDARNYDTDFGKVYWWPTEDPENTPWDYAARVLKELEKAP